MNKKEKEENGEHGSMKRKVHGKQCSSRKTVQFKKNSAVRESNVEQGMEGMQNLNRP